MLAAVLGWFWIITGAIFLLKPQWLRRRLQKKSYRRIRGILFSLTIFVGALFIVTALKYQGLLAKVVLILGIIGIIKAFFLLKSKVAEKIIDWFSRQSLAVFRVLACLNILVGILLLKLR